MYLACLKQNGLYQWRRSRWGRVPPAKNLPKNRGKEGGNREKEEKSGRKGKNRDGSFTLPLLTDRAGYAIGLYKRNLFYKGTVGPR